MKIWLRRSFEKALKGGSRRKKLLMIDRFNPEWRDLYADFA
jgi:predicted GIY-YIG superfamily endonuclease